ncbi:hypothetical protein DIS24_g8068 [Lasiodiplodia hormozganensis]|uniref:Uncharacterized protein n=1 Tax=Lasiodiplodia hormozganensis TaxID=869390 RepID=A0AA39Y3Z4_9PEZI|nr:hypothetical protein DIS24_g8068 [Lasiodiplodia hormozganensis]
MAVEVNFQSVEDIEFTASERAIFNVLKATLQYPANPQTKATKLAADIEFFCNSAEGAAAIDELLWYLWAVIVEIAQQIPPGHPWQVSLIESLDNLRQRDGSVLGSDKSTMLWKDLPNLSACVREKWIDPTDSGEDPSDNFAKWVNLNSFIAGLTRKGFAPWLNLPIWQLRAALEEPIVKGPAMECRLQVASEWLLHCAGPIFKDMKLDEDEEVDESLARALRTGPLCEGKAPQSVERWNFWKKRLSELSGELGSLEVDPGIKGRISDALKSMEVAEK